MKKIAILGSTGSIGTQTLEVVRNNRDIKVVALAAGSNIQLLEQQIRECEEAQGACGSDYVKLQELQAKQAELEAALEEKTERWMYLTELKEKIDAQ